MKKVLLVLSILTGMLFLNCSNDEQTKPIEFKSKEVELKKEIKIKLNSKGESISSLTDEQLAIQTVKNQVDGMYYTDRVAQVTCLQGQQDSSSTYWHSCVNVNGTNYFVEIVYNNMGVVTHTQANVMTNCSCDDSW